MSWDDSWQPYVPVRTRIRRGERVAAERAREERRSPEPVSVSGRQIARTIWGRAWCDHLAAFQDYANRLPRGAGYVRNGSVVDLVIRPQRIDAIVAGSDTYEVGIDISRLPDERWNALRRDCSAEIDSLLDLLSGKLADGVMRRLTDLDSGLFPRPAEITMRCSCPDWSRCCKHLAAVMYGVGARLDSRPELLFLLRGVDHEELVSHAMAAGNLERELGESAEAAPGPAELSEIFGIELDTLSPQHAESGPSVSADEPAPTSARRRRTTAKGGRRGRASSGDPPGRQTSPKTRRSKSTTARKTAVKTTAAAKKTTGAAKKKTGAAKKTSAAKQAGTATKTPSGRKTKARPAKKK